VQRSASRRSQSANQKSEEQFDDHDGYLIRSSEKRSREQQTTERNETTVRVQETKEDRASGRIVSLPPVLSSPPFLCQIGSSLAWFARARQGKAPAVKRPRPIRRCAFSRQESEEPSLPSHGPPGRIQQAHSFSLTVVALSASTEAAPIPHAAVPPSRRKNGAK
jgi:hypothetical protein